MPFPGLAPAQQQLLPPGAGMGGPGNNMMPAQGAQPMFQNPAGGPNVVTRSGGYDPRNSLANEQTPDWNEMAHGKVPPGTETSTKQVLRSMHNAYANKGVNPYDSHPEMKAKWEKAWKDKANRDALKAAGGQSPDQGNPMEPGAIGYPAKREAAMVDRMIQAAKQRAAFAGLTPATRPNVINMAQGLNSNG